MGTAKGTGDEARIEAALADLHAAQREGDLDRIAAAFTEVGLANGFPRRREGMRRYFAGLIARGSLRSQTVDATDCEISVDGDRAGVGPLHYRSGEAHIATFYDMQREGDAWRIRDTFQILNPRLERWARSYLTERPIEEAWSILTEPRHLEQWMCNRARVDLRVGGEFELTGDYVYDRGGGQRITRLEPGRLIGFDWPLERYTVEVTWSAEPVLDLTRVTVEHTMTAEAARRAVVDLRTRYRIPETYAHHLVAYLEMGFCPARLTCSPSCSDTIRFDMALPASAEAIMAALTDPVRFAAWAGADAQDMWRWYPERSADGRSARLAGNSRQLGELFAVIDDGEAGADVEGAMFTIQPISSGDAPEARLRVVLSGFGNKDSFFGVYWGWQGYLTRLALYAVQGRETSTWEEFGVWSRAGTQAGARLGERDGA